MHEVVTLFVAVGIILLLVMVGVIVHDVQTLLKGLRRTSHGYGER